MRSFNIVVVALFTVSLCHAGFLVGVGFDPNSSNKELGLPYHIDPMTGATTLITENFTWIDGGSVSNRDNHLYFYSLGDSPFPGTMFYSDGWDLHTVNFDTGVVANYYASWYGGAPNLAYDSDHNVLYSSWGDRLATIPLVNCSAGTCPPGTTVGTFPAHIFIYALGYVPGEGLYGVDALSGMLYRIDPNTATPTPVGPTGVGPFINGLSVTDIEFDAGTGRMIASAGGPEPHDPNYYGPPTAYASGKIYLLDRFTGETTLLNDNAPNFFGLVEVSSPEPANLILIGAGLLALGLRRRASVRHGSQCDMA